MKRPEQLRSQKWFAPDTPRAFAHRSRAAQMGYTRADYGDKPIIAIINTWSDINQCHSHFRETAAHVRRGITQAGGFAVELPAMSLSEPFQKPTTMLYRNFLAMEVEELLRSYPVDGAVLLGGCDKTTPALIMAAATVNLPAIFVPAGPMLRGNWRGRPLASGTDIWRGWAERRAGNLSDEDWRDMETGIARTAGHCMTMGTASTMTSVVEVLGLSLPMAASTPAPDSGHARLAAEAGRRAVQLVWDDLTPRTMLTREAFLDAVVTCMAIGGSTNAVIHLVAMARRAGVPLTLDDFDMISRKVPVLADVQPAGRFLMEDFYYAGGLPALLTRLRDHLHLDRPTVSGRTLGENIATARVYNDEVIRPYDNPVWPEGGIAVLRGNLAPNGAIIKHVAMDPRLRRHRGPAFVFESYADVLERLEDTRITPDTVLVLRNLGPVGGPGMPEAGMIPIPDRLLKEGVRDMVRVSDARMSGTAYGACVLHVSPEAFIGGPLALVRDGDLIELDVDRGRIDLLVDEDELRRRRAEWVAPPPRFTRGFGVLFSQHVLQADQGCDFDVLADSTPTPEPEFL